MIHDRIENFNLYPFGKTWDEAFSFIQQANVEYQDKRYDLSSGMYAVIDSYLTKSYEQAVIESHQKYIDIQWTIEGAEAIVYAPTTKLEIKTPYSPETDVQFYKQPEIIRSQVSNLAGHFTMLLPEDAHMPQLKVEGFERVKKGVIKIPKELLLNQ